MKCENPVKVYCRFFFKARVYFLKSINTICSTSDTFFFVKCDILTIYFDYTLEFH